MSIQEIQYVSHPSEHVLGRIGKLDVSEVEEYVNNKGYAYDELVGREGVEKAFEDYLHGYNGIERYEIDKNNNVINVETVKEAKNGYSVMLTIDAEMQAVAEKALQEQIDIAKSIGESDTVPHNGEDCNAGSVVVMNPKNGHMEIERRSRRNTQICQPPALISVNKINRKLTNKAPTPSTCRSTSPCPCQSTKSDR